MGSISAANASRFDIASSRDENTASLPEEVIHELPESAIIGPTTVEELAGR